MCLFLCADSGTTTRSISDPGLHSTSLSPQSVSSGGDSGVDSYSDPMSDLPTIAISLCGGLTDNREITKGKLLSFTQGIFKRHYMDSVARCRNVRLKMKCVCMCLCRAVP